MTALVQCWCSLLGAAALAVAALTSAAAAEPGAADLSPNERLELFRQETPAARLRLIEALPRSGEQFQKVTRGNVISTIVERGALEAATVSDIVCRVKARTKGNATATTVKWVVDDGTSVKKGDRLVELDDSAIVEQILAQKVAHDSAVAARIQAEEDLKRAQKLGQVDVRLGEIAVRLAELELKKAAGADKEQREILELHIERARLQLEKTKADFRAKEKQAEADLRARVSLAEQEAARLADLEEERKNCVLTAPRDGFVIYYVPEQARFGSGAGIGIVAVGEPVREGQRLMQVCDLKRMQVRTRIHEALISRVRRGQKATVRVDAFPDKRLSGAVGQVATVASQQDWLAGDVKVYATTINLEEGIADLKPGMSAEVTILVDERTGVVQVPVQAVTYWHGKPRCFVKTADGIEEREVVAGVSSDFAVEIKSGLKEGDLILRDPRAVLRRLPLKGPKADRPAPDRQGNALLKPTELLVRSVRPAPEDGRAARTRVMAYGLTYDDLKRMEAVAGVAELVPVRIIPSSAYRAETGHRSARVIATTPAFADAADLQLAAGRFLNEKDEQEMNNVAVLGSDVAEKLFGDKEALGESVRLGNYFYRVVGVVRERKEGFPGLGPDWLNDAVYIPLKTCQVRFGERVFIREAGSLRGEQVALSAVLVRATRAEKVPAVAEAVRSLLEAAHQRKDWDVLVPDGR
jgi:multidrug resistance efflux pump